MTQKVQEIAQEVVDNKENMNTGDVATHVSKVQEMIESENKEQMAEIEDRLKRKCNLVIFRLPEKDNTTESDSTDATARGTDEVPRLSAKEEDKDLVRTILQQVGAKPVPNDVRRLGKYNRESSKPRPVRLSFNSEKERDEVLTLAYRSNKNKTEGNDKLCHKVILRKDLTVQEREEEDRLYAELKNKRQGSKASGDYRARWVRRRGQIVNIGDYTTPVEKEAISPKDEDREREEGATRWE